MGTPWAGRTDRSGSRDPSAPCGDTTRTKRITAMRRSVREKLSGSKRRGCSSFLSGRGCGCSGKDNKEEEGQEGGGSFRKHHFLFLLLISVCLCVVLCVCGVFVFFFNDFSQHCDEKRNRTILLFSLSLLLIFSPLSLFTYQSHMHTLLHTREERVKDKRERDGGKNQRTRAF